MARFARLLWAVPTTLAVLALVKGAIESTSEAPAEQRFAPAIVDRMPPPGRLRAPDDARPMATMASPVRLRVRPAAIPREAAPDRLAASGKGVKRGNAQPVVEPPADGGEIFYPITTASDVPLLPEVWPGRTVRSAPSTSVRSTSGLASPLPTAPIAADGRPMVAVREQVSAINQKAVRLAERGALYSARAELLEALHLLAQAQDAQARSTSHVAALDAALTALAESDDFSSLRQGHPSASALAAVIRSHRTPVLKRVDASRLSSLTAGQHYLAYAQQQLTTAVGNDRSAAGSLYLLGKVHSHLASESNTTRSSHTARAMVCHQSALAVDPQHYQAANELGVLLASFGELTAARKALVASVTNHGTPSAWHNLAKVHERLGETDLARRARYESELLTAKGPKAGSGQTVQWIDAATFAARSRAEGAAASGGQAAVATATMPAETSSSAVRR